MTNTSWVHAGVTALVLISMSNAGCSNADAASEVGMASEALCRQPRQLRLAWLGNSPLNTYDNAIRDAAAGVALFRRAKVVPFYASWDASVQLQQCRAAVRSGRFDAVMVLPNDPIGIVACVEEAEDRGVPVVALDLPIGPDPNTAEPQVPGQVGAVLIPAGNFGANLASLVVDRCTGLAECNIVYLAGTFGIAFDDIAIQHLEATASAHPHIELVATAEAFYLEDEAYRITTDLLAEDPNVHMIVSGGDQMARGAERALSDYGTLPHPLDVVGAGAGEYGIQAVREGRWYATFVGLPSDEGALGADIAIRAARGEQVDDPGINPVERRGYPAFFTSDNQDSFADFTPQWPG